MKISMMQPSTSDGSIFLQIHTGPVNHFAKIIPDLLTLLTTAISEVRNDITKVDLLDSCITSGTVYLMIFEQVEKLDVTDKCESVSISLNVPDLTSEELKLSDRLFELLNRFMLVNQCTPITLQILSKGSDAAR
jgi:hypothetical protein